MSKQFSEVGRVLDSICRVIEFLVSRICRDEAEWESWGNRTVTMLSDAMEWNSFNQHGWADLRSDVFEAELSGSGEDEDDSWHVIHDRVQSLRQVLEYLRLTENKAAVASVLQKITHEAFSCGAYDSRCRSLIRELISAVGLSQNMLTDLESQATSMRSYFTQQDVKNIGQALTPYRSLQVCAVSLSTGAVMYGVGVLTAPAVIMAAVNTAGAVSIAGELISSASVACVSTLARAAAVTATGIALKRMVHRTEPISQFRLEALFSVPTTTSSSDVDEKRHYMEEVDAVKHFVVETVESQCLSLSSGESEPGDHTNDQLSVIEERAVIKSHPSKFDEAPMTSESIQIDSCPDAEVSTSVIIVDDPGASVVSAKSSGLMPVYFLIPGHVGREDDLKDIFGGPRFTSVLNTKEGSNEFDSTAASTSFNIVNQSEISSGIINIEKSWWREIFPRGEEYILHWDRTDLGDFALNDKIKSFVEGELVSSIRDAALTHFALNSLWGSFGWAKFVLDEVAELDGPWAIALDRSKQAGRMLARLLIANKFCQMDSEAPVSIKNDLAQKVKLAVSSFDVAFEPEMWEEDDVKLISRSRPVNLIGYGMGARVIYHCLEELDAAPGMQGRGIVENAVLMGTPVGTDFGGWSAGRRVVSGRLISCYSKRDWFLALMYRSNVYEPMVAGLQPFSLRRSVAYGIKAAGMCYMLPPPVVEAEIRKDHVGNFEAQISDKLIDDTLLNYSNDVECVDVTHFITSHTDYPAQLYSILKVVKLENYAS